jgi:hypothetical protein
MKNTQDTSKPAAKIEGLITQELADELLVYDERKHKAHCLNQTAWKIWQECNGENSIAEISKRTSEKLNATVDEELVMVALAELGKNGLLKEPVTFEAMSRRAMMRRLGIGAAIAIPMVTSIVAPKAISAATCTASGGPCTTSAQCCSGLCSGSVCA